MFLFGQMRSHVADNTIPYSEFMRRAEEGLFVRVKIEGSKLQGRTETNEVIVSNAPPDVFMASDLRKGGRGDRRRKPRRSGLFSPLSLFHGFPCCC